MHTHTCTHTHMHELPCTHTLQCVHSHTHSASCCRTSRPSPPCRSHTPCMLGNHGTQGHTGHMTYQHTRLCMDTGRWSDHTAQWSFLLRCSCTAEEAQLYYSVCVCVFVLIYNCLLLCINVPCSPLWGRDPSSQFYSFHRTVPLCGRGRCTRRSPGCSSLQCDYRCMLGGKWISQSEVKDMTNQPDLLTISLLVPVQPLERKP